MTNTVVSSPFQDASVLFDAVTPAWQEFCHTTLSFAIPDDLRYACAEQGPTSDMSDQP